MTTKTAKPVQNKKETSKKTTSHLEGKVEKKIVAAEKTEMDMSPMDPDEIEDQEDAASQSSHSGGGNAAALAAAAGSNTEMSASFKNFRHHPDMENFYRFIYENDLRHEALAIIDDIMAEKQQRKLVKGAKAQSH
jgi:type I site-specific restriction-modification system R (restriction) subunit